MTAATSFSTDALASPKSIVVFGSWIGFSSYMYLLQATTVARASTYAYVNPVVAVFLGWLILNERLTAVSVMAMFVILVGVGLVQTAGWRKKAGPAENTATIKNAA